HLAYSGSRRFFFRDRRVKKEFGGHGIGDVSDTSISRIHFGCTRAGGSDGGAVNPSAASTSTSARARPGYRITSSVAAPAPKEWPTTMAGEAFSAASTSLTRAA